MIAPPHRFDDLDFVTAVRLQIYEHFVQTGRAPSARELADQMDTDEASVRDAWTTLVRDRLLVLSDDGRSIRMAAPFSGVPTQHVTEADGVVYWGNCAWDALGIAAALRTSGTVYSRCEQSGEPLTVEVARESPPLSRSPDLEPWVFHTPVPVTRWWKDVGFT